MIEKFQMHITIPPRLMILSLTRRVLCCVVFLYRWCINSRYYVLFFWRPFTCNTTGNNKYNISCNKLLNNAKYRHCICLWCYIVQSNPEEDNNDFTEQMYSIRLISDTLL